MSNAARAPASGTGKLRLRSTPRAFWRVPAAAPSGFASAISQTAVPARRRAAAQRADHGACRRARCRGSSRRRAACAGRRRADPERPDRPALDRLADDRRAGAAAGWAGASAAVTPSAVAKKDTCLSMVADLTAELAEKAAAHGRVAIDTEFVSERRYQALLCLAQVAVPDPDAPDGVHTEVLDPLGDDPPDPGPLARVLADPEVEVVVHAGRQDIAILRRTWETDVTRVFDTQLAAGFIGYGNQEGLVPLVRKVLDVRLKGAEGFTKWDRRPLTAQQLSLVLWELQLRADGVWKQMRSDSSVRSGRQQRNFAHSPTGFRPTDAMSISGIPLGT